MGTLTPRVPTDLITCEYWTYGGWPLVYRRTIAGALAILGLVTVGATGCTGGASSVSLTLSSPSGSFKSEEMVTAEPSWGLSTQATAANVGAVVCRDVSLSGKQLTVKDNDGRTVGVVTLPAPDAQDIDGTLVANSAYAKGESWGRVSTFATAKCVTTASVDVTGDSDFYSVIVSGISGEMQYDSDELRSGISLSY